LKPGEELFYDYGLVIDERYTVKLKKQFECRCGKPKCRGTMLAPKLKPATRAAAKSVERSLAKPKRVSTGAAQK
jgi:hypothetical protein